jgi:hypothetical protein
MENLNTFYMPQDIEKENDIMNMPVDILLHYKKTRN